MKKTKSLSFKSILTLLLFSLAFLPLYAPDYPEEVLKVKNSIKGKILPRP